MSKLKYFGTDGVRGVANETLTPELAFKLGRAAGYVLSKRVEIDQKPFVMIGRDTRISGEMLQAAVVSGFLSVGVDVLRLGVIPTPGIAYLVKSQNAFTGVQITASHNPAKDNGIKLFANDGFKLSDEIELEIEHYLDATEDTLPRPNAEGLGVVRDYKEGIQKYISFLKQTIQSDITGMKICIDGANGATSSVIPKLFADLGADFETMAINPDGLNINAGVGSTHPENLAKFVVESNAEIGLAYDGDGDRLIAVDEKGNIIDGDKIMFIVAKYLNEQGRLKHNSVVSTVMSNIGFYKALEENDMQSVQTAVGDRYVVERMLADDYNFGGEQSGHIVFLDWSTTGDGLLTSLQLLNIIKVSGKSLNELASEIFSYPQVLINVPVKDKVLAKEDEEVIAAINKVEETLQGNGRVLVRPSGTEELLRVMVEAETDELANDYAMQIAKVVEQKYGN